MSAHVPKMLTFEPGDYVLKSSRKRYPVGRTAVVPYIYIYIYTQTARAVQSTRRLTSLANKKQKRQDRDHKAYYDAPSTI